MLNADLVKKIYEAGFPKDKAISIETLLFEIGDDFYQLTMYQPDPEDPFYRDIRPEAIGMAYHAQSKGEWREVGDDDADKVRCEPDCCGQYGHGNTPFDAVANLYLSIKR